MTIKTRVLVVLSGMFLVAGLGVAIFFCAQTHKANRIARGLRSGNKREVLERMDEVSRTRLHWQARRLVEDALVEVMDKTDDLDLIRVGILTSDAHRGGSMRVAEDPGKRAILQKAMEKYNAKVGWEKWQLMKCDDGTYFTANTISTP